MFASKANLEVFFKKVLNGEASKWPMELRKKFIKTLIIAFEEVIMQPLIHTLFIAQFLPFLAYCVLLYDFII